MSLIFLELGISDASLVARSSKNLLRLFCSSSHFRLRLAKEFCTVKVEPRQRHGKGAKKKQTKNVLDESAFEEYRRLHLARRATFRTLLSFGRVRGKRETLRKLVSVLSLVPCNQQRNVVTSEFAAIHAAEPSQPGKAWSASSQKAFKVFASTYTNPDNYVFPVGCISTEENALVVPGPQHSLSMSLVDMVLFLTGGQLQPQFRKNRGSAPLPRFTQFQWQVLVEEKIVCRCGNLLW